LLSTSINLKRIDQEAWVKLLSHVKRLRTAHATEIEWLVKQQFEDHRIFPVNERNVRLMEQRDAIGTAIDIAGLDRAGVLETMEATRVTTADSALELLDSEPLQEQDALRIDQVGISQFAYDANDNLTTVTDPRGLLTTYGYTGFGDLVAQISPDTGTTTNTYDAGGNLISATDARGAVSTYAYDALGRVTSKTQVVGAQTVTLGYAYTNGNLTTLTTPAGRTVVYGYNSNHQIVSVSLNGTQILGSVTYEPFGAVNGWTWGNGTSTSRRTMRMAT
jgi:YD repeat-containing protein